MSAEPAWKRILRALVELGNEASPGELQRHTGVPSRTVGAALAKLRAEGLVEGKQTCPRLTANGRTAGQAHHREPVGRFEEAVEAAFGPSPALAAFCRLGADVVVARWLYPERTFHPSLLAYGPPQRGKTAAAELLARGLGLGPEAIVHVPALTPGEVFVRRRAGDFEPEPARHLALPFFCLDEVGELEAEMRRTVQLLCHGDPVVPVDRRDIRIGTAMATWNPRGGVKVFAEAYYRRAVTLCVDEVRVPDLDERLRRLDHSGGGAGTLPLERYRAVTEALEDPCFAVLGTVAEVLTDDGRQRFERRTLELATLGRAARYGRGAGADLRGLAYFVGTDYLTVTETVPGLVGDWHLPLDKLAVELAGAPELEELAAVVQRRNEARNSVAVVLAGQRQAAAVQDLELTGARATFVQGTKDVAALISRVPPAYRARAAGLRAQLGDLRKGAGEARSMARIAELVALARPVLEGAAALRREIDDELARQALEKESDRLEHERQNREAKEIAANFTAQQRAAKKAAGVYVRGLKSRRGSLIKLRGRSSSRQGSSPADTLVAEGLLEVQQSTVEVPMWRPKFLGGPTTRREQRTWLVDRQRRRWPPSAFIDWGAPAVLEVLDIELAAVEAELARFGAGAQRTIVAARALPVLPPGIL
jgi:hypothetical protein